MVPMHQLEIGDKIRFIRSLRAVMKVGNYDILHCHHDIMSAAYLAASAGLPFRKRIVHVHNTSLSLPTQNRVKAELVREPMRQMCLRMADQTGEVRDRRRCAQLQAMHQKSAA